jgi:parallel beta-helix repeat protein
MRLIMLAAALPLLGVGCGSSTGQSGGAMTFRALWESPGTTASARSTQTAPGSPAEIASGSFGPQLPAAVQTIQIVIRSDAGARCCLAVNPQSVPSGVLVLDALPAGPATVTLAGFATDFAPAPSGVTSECAADPAGAGRACVTSRYAAPSYQSDPQPVSIVTGAETDAGDIPVYAVPFLLTLKPVPSSAVTSPVSFMYTVVDAVAGVDGSSINLAVTPSGQFPINVPLTVTACSDHSGTPCSPCGQLGVAGFVVSSATTSVAAGPAQARIDASNLASPPRSLDFTYPFQITGPAQLVRAAVSVIIVRAPASIAAAAKRAPAGSTIVVAPGVYAPVALAEGDLPGPITMLADVTGVLTNSAAAAVVIDGKGQSPAFALSNQSDVTIDGFTLRGTVDAAVLVQGGSDIVVQNATISGGSGDGVRFESSTNGVVFDNLIYNNFGTGIAIGAATSLRVINNTVYNNTNTGVLVSDSCDVKVENNISNRNQPAGIVETSTGEYSADFNLNTDGYGTTTPAGAHDINRDPLFVAPGVGDFHLARGLAGSTSPGINSGDPATAPDLAGVLESRTTQSDGTLDTPPVDLGYHYSGSTPPAIPGS